MFFSFHLADCRKALLPILVAVNICLFLLLCFSSAGNPGVLDADIQESKDVGGVSLPILMYHDILKNPAKQQPYVISPAKLEQDLIYLKENGYQTVVVEDLVAFVEHNVPLPEKPILITFDDGYFNNVYYAEPLLQKYEMRAVIFVVGAFCERAVAEGEENPNYSYIQWDRLSQMVKSGVWDVQSHSWNMHKVSGKRMGVQRNSGQTQQQYHDALYTDFSQITEKLTEVLGTPPLAFAYPYGAMDDEAEVVLKDLGYKVTLCSNSGQSVLVPGQPETLFRLRRLARINTRSAESLLGK